VRRFLAWDIDESTQDVMDILKDMIDAVYDDDVGDETDGGTQGASIEEVDGGEPAAMASRLDQQEDTGSATEGHRQEPRLYAQEQDDQEGYEDQHGGRHALDLGDGNQDMESTEQQAQDVRKPSDASKSGRRGLSGSL
jgi:hypothetical protein